MSNSTEVSATCTITVPFHGASLLLIENEGQPYTPMKPMVSGIGLNWSGQFEKVKENETRWGIRNIQIPSTGGMQGAICLPLRKLPGWLATLEPKKIKRADVAARVIQYQNECDNVLWKYWNEGAAFNPRAFSVNPGDELTQDEQDTLRALLQSAAERLPKAQRGKFMMQGWSKLKSHFKVAYREIPRSEFSAAVSIVTRHTVEWEVVNDAPPQTAIEPDADRTASAFMASQSIGAQVQKAAFNAILAGGDDWKHQHWEISFITDSSEAIPALVQKMDADEFVISVRRLTRDISKPGSTKFSSAELAHLNAACSMSLSERMEHQDETRMLAA